MHTRFAAFGLVFVLVVAGCDTRPPGPAPILGVDGGHASRPIAPSGCASTRVCADRLDCEDGERCNTALARPTCQAILCGAAGTACSEDALCATGLVCLAGACLDPAATVDPIAGCEDRCRRCQASDPECISSCATLSESYAGLRTDYPQCAADIDAWTSCDARVTECESDGAECQDELEAWVACVSG